MCGIVGIISKTKKGFFDFHINTFNQLLFVDQLRGTDGTGIFYDNDGKMMFLKQAENASNFLGSKQYQKSRSAALSKGRVLFGHNRSATKGSTVWKNTHPFVEGNIVLIHNGTLVNHHALANTEVDSNAIAVHMNIHGAEKTLEEINGAFALAWVNMKDNTINLCRNSQRPLSIIETNDCWIIVSELDMGLWIAGRNGLKIVSSTEVKEATLCTFDLNELVLSSYKTKEVTLRQPIQQAEHGGWKGWAKKYNLKYTDDTELPTANNTFPEGFKVLSDKDIQYIDKEAFFSGEKIRFVPDQRIQQHALGYLFVMGHVYHRSAANVPEFQQRVKIMGSKQFLEDISKEKLLEAVVTGCIVDGKFDQDEVYYVRSVVPVTNKHPPKKKLELVVSNNHKDTFVLEKCVTCKMEIHDTYSMTLKEAGHECAWCNGTYEKENGFGAWGMC